MNAFIYVKDGQTYARISCLNLDQKLDGHKDLMDFVLKHGVESLWKSSSIDFPEEYGWDKAKSPAQYLGIV